MLTISETANKEIEKAQRAIHKAIEALTQSKAYNNSSDIFHNCTVADVNRLITASLKLNN